jgi:hypothetical protein
MLDADTAGLYAAVTPYFNNNTITGSGGTVRSSSRLQTAVPLGLAWQTARNISISIITSIDSAARPFFYIWEPRWTFESAPIYSLSWEISPSTFGMEGFKHFGLCKVAHVSTANLHLIFTVDGVVQPTIIIPHSNGIYKETIFRVPVMKGKIYKLRLDSAAEWRLDGRDSFFEVKDWGTDLAYTPMRIFGDYAEIQG